MQSAISVLVGLPMISIVNSLSEDAARTVRRHETSWIGTILVSLTWSFDEPEFQTRARRAQRTEHAATSPSNVLMSIVAAVTGIERVLGHFDFPSSSDLRDNFHKLLLRQRLEIQVALPHAQLGLCRFRAGNCGNKLFGQILIDLPLPIERETY